MFGQAVKAALPKPKGQMTNQQKDDIKKTIKNSGQTNQSGGPAKFAAFKQKVDEGKKSGGSSSGGQSSGGSSSGGKSRRAADEE